MNTDRDTRWADLLRAANSGDRAAYAQFLTEISPVVRGVIVARNRGRKDECEDILQDTLIAIHEKRHTWREGDPVTSWIYAIARYKTVDAWRRRARTAAAPLDEFAIQVADPTATDPSATRDVEKLLGTLDTATARLVRDVKLNGASAEEAGAPNGMTAGAVRVALHRALARLAAEVGVAFNDGKRPRK